MAKYSVLDARNNLSRVIADAQAGQEVVITNRGIPVVQVVPFTPSEIVRNGPPLAEWLEAARRTRTQSRSAADLDAQIAEERAAWD